MIKRLFFAATMMLTAVSGKAGTIANGVWSPSGCGAESVVPVIDQSVLMLTTKASRPSTTGSKKPMLIMDA